ncbi:unnamed protein product [Periconia digitata]|uniref:Uncharacterized protein n=1 Tax=Periconia digitata TaxID=1303443 RepID=A0A9W4UP71_9PLEO|nr:unnamed protein product [Periconia digitata]
MNDTHIDDILSLGQDITAKIATFHFSSTDNSYSARSGMGEVTSAALERLARAMPNLKKVILQDTYAGEMDGYFAFAQFCPQITYFEAIGVPLKDEYFSEFTRHPEWAPNLKKMRISQPYNPNPKALAEMRKFSKARPRLPIQLLERSSVKKWGDWEYEENVNPMQNGRMKTALHYS